MSDNQPVEEPASALAMALAGCSIIWILAASLLASFLVALGTLACGAICDKMAPVWIITGALFALLLVFCIWLFMAMLRRKISSRLFSIMLGIDVILLASLIGIGIVLGGI